MKVIVNIVVLVFSISAYSQGGGHVSEHKVVQILEGSKQKLFTECGEGNTSIKQTVTITHAFSYKIETVLWLQYYDDRSYDCYGSWGYDLMTISKEIYSREELAKEKKRQTDKAFELLNYLQEEGNH